MKSDPDAQQVVMVIAIWAGIIVPILFAIQYTYIAQWWRRPTGRLIIALDLLICLARLPRAWELLHHHAVALPVDPVTLSADVGIPLVIMCRMAAFEIQRRRGRQQSLREARVFQMQHPAPQLPSTDQLSGAG